MDQHGSGSRKDALVQQLLNGIFRVLITGIRRNDMDGKKHNNAGSYYRKHENFIRIIERMKSIPRRPPAVSAAFTACAVRQHEAGRYPAAVDALKRAFRVFPDRKGMMAHLTGIVSAAAGTAAAKRQYHAAAACCGTAMELASVRTIARRTGRMVETLREKSFKREI